MEEKWGWPGFLGALVLLTIFAIITISAAGVWPWFSEVNGSTWASWGQFIGSLLAVGVALNLADKGTREKLKQDRDRASLVAARLNGVVEALLSNTGRCMALLAFSLHFDGGQFTKIRQYMVHVKLNLNQISIDDLSNLVPLPEHTAHRLARAIALYEALANEIERLEAGTASFNRREASLRKDWLERLHRGQDLLRVVSTQLENAANKDTPYPTHEELHGELDDSDLY